MGVPDICLLTTETDYAAGLCAFLPDGVRVHVAARPEDLRPAAVTLLDADAFPAVRPEGTYLVRYGRAIRESDIRPGADGENWHRPFPFERLARLPLLPAAGAAALRHLPARGVFLLNGRPLPLSDREYRVLSALFAADGAPVPRAALARVAFADTPATDGPGDIDADAPGASGPDGIDADTDRRLTMLFHRLREKTEPDGVRRLFSVYKQGYRLLCDREEAVL